MNLLVPLSHRLDLQGFNDEATQLLARQVPPERVEWQVQVGMGEMEVPGAQRIVRTRAARAVVPQSFVRTSELVVLHRDPARFDLLYRALWRLVNEVGLKDNPSDPELVRLRQMAHAVRRDMQKMKARLVFRSLVVRGEPLAFAWHEPTHFICEVVGGWLARRKPDGRWLILTPHRCVRLSQGRLFSAPPLAPQQTPVPSAPDSVWARVLQEQPWV